VKKAASRAVGRRRVLKAAVLLGAAALTPNRAGHAQASRKAAPTAKSKVAAMSDDLARTMFANCCSLNPMPPAASCA
jgi:hypothetical protein